MTRRARAAALAIVVLALVAALRLLGTVGFTDDHYMHLAGAQQIRFGGWPSHDFVDLGMPLMYGVSAAAQAAFGPSLLTEACLVALAFGIAAALTLVAALRLTGSMAVALLVVAVEVLIFPRSYSYPKVLLYAAGILAMWRYTDRPSTGNLLLLALASVVAFLFRHDHGLYIGGAAALAVVLQAWSGGARLVLQRVMRFGGAALALLAPYLLYLQAGVGVMHHVATGLAFRSVESGRSLADLPRFAAGDAQQNAVAWLFYVFYALPVAALVLAGRSERLRIVPLAVLALLANVGLVRDILAVRLPDVVVTAALLVGWLLHRAWRRERPRAGLVLRLAATVVAVITVASAAVVGAAREQLDRAGVFAGPARLPEHAEQRLGQLQERFAPGQVPSPVVYALQPFLEYADRCLGPQDHVLVPSFNPEIAVWARQPFAGGQIWYQPGVLASPAHHRFVMERLAVERVPAVIVKPGEFALLAAGFPELGAFVRERFTRVAAWAVPQQGEVHVLLDARLASGRDAETGWPCFQ